MLTRIDRVQLAVPDRSVAGRWSDLLGAEHEADDRVDALGARRSSYRLGDGCVEFLEPDGAGPVADAVRRRGGHLFAGGVATPDIDKLVAHMRDRGVDPAVEGGQVFLGPEETGGHGLRVVVSAEADRPQTGAVIGLYEVTNLVRDASACTAHYAGLFGLDAVAFEPIESRHYGYTGTLTLFAPDRLDRLEVITPDAPDNTMGRFFERFGESLYMAFAEVDDPGAIEARALELGVAFTPVPSPSRREGAEPDTVFLHPGALGGMMLGLSRRSHAWIWSGRPDRVVDGPERR